MAPGPYSLMRSPRSSVAHSDEANYAVRSACPDFRAFRCPLTKKQPGKDIIIMTSRQLGQSLVELDLVDEYRLIVLPALLGSGKALFGKTKTTLSLVKATPFKKTGAVALQYAVQRS